MKAGWKELIWLIGILLTIFVIISLVLFYGGFPLPAAAVAADCRAQAVEAHQGLLTALTRFGDKSRKRLMMESEGRLAEILAGCEANRERGITW
jgi:hypothetical protein